MTATDIDPVFFSKDIFILFLNMFKELSDTASPHFLRRVKVLETVARCKCCVIMLDVDCHDLVLEMFKIFFSSVRLECSLFSLFSVFFFVFVNSVNIIENSVLDLFSMVFLMFSFSSFFLPFGS